MVLSVALNLVCFVAIAVMAGALVDAQWKNEPGVYHGSVIWAFYPTTEGDGPYGTSKEKYQEIGKAQVAATGYSRPQLVRMQRAFDSKTTIRAGLLEIVKLLVRIHRVSSAKKRETKARFKRSVGEHCLTPSAIRNGRKSY